MLTKDKPFCYIYEVDNNFEAVTFRCSKADAVRYAKLIVRDEPCVIRSVPVARRMSRRALVEALLNDTGWAAGEGVVIATVQPRRKVE